MNNKPTLRPLLISVGAGVKQMITAGIENTNAFSINKIATYSSTNKPQSGSCVPGHCSGSCSGITSKFSTNN